MQKTCVETPIVVVGKKLCRNLLDCLHTNIADVALPESQCGFCHGRGAVHMIFFCEAATREVCRAKNGSLSGLC